MKFLLPLLCIFLLAVTAEAGIGVGTEVEFQAEKEYEMEIMNSKIDLEVESQTFSLIADLQPNKSITLTPKIGVAMSEIEVEDMLKIENDVGLACGIEADIAVLELFGITVSAIGAYDYLRTEVDQVEVNNMVFDNIIRNDIDIHSYEAGVKASMPIKDIVPYFGCVWSKSEGNLEVPMMIANIDLDATSKTNFGLRGGLTGKVGKGWNVNVDCKLLDETAGSLSVAYKF